MNIKKLFISLDNTPFGYKSAFLLFIIIGGMLSIITLSQISTYTIKNDFDLLFEKRTKSIIRLEAIKDTYIININETLRSMKNNHITKEQGAEVIALAKQLIDKNWSKYREIINSEKYQLSFINKFIKEIFTIGSEKPNHILKKSFIDNIDKRNRQINKLLDQIFTTQGDIPEEFSFLLSSLNYEVHSISIYITSLSNYDLSVAIEEKQDTDHIYEILSFILNISTVLVFIFSVLLSILIITNFKKLHLSLKGDVLQKSEALQQLNDSLEIRIEQEVSNSRKKELIMFQQARLASMGEMIANIAHQWRQPLSSIMIIIQGLQTKTELGKLTPEVLNEKVEDALLLGYNMSQTLENFQNFFKPTKTEEKFFLIDCITHSIALSKYRFKNNKIRVSIKVPKDIVLYNYYNELSHVFINIIANAEDALRSIKGEKFIEIIVKKMKDKIYIYIVDNGGGINEDIMPHIFEPYFTTKYKSSGTGLGLYMSQQMIEKHLQGTVRCKNVCYTINNKKFDHCTLFTIIIPT